MLNFAHNAYWTKNQHELSFCCHFLKDNWPIFLHREKWHHAISSSCQKLLLSEPCCFLNVPQFWLKNVGYWILHTLNIGRWSNKSCRSATIFEERLTKVFAQKKWQWFIQFFWSNCFVIQRSILFFRKIQVISPEAKIQLFDDLRMLNLIVGQNVRYF